MEYASSVTDNGFYNPTFFDDTHCEPKFDKLTECYQMYWNDLCRYLRSRFSHSVLDPEDVAQAVFIKFAELENVSHITNIKSVIFKMATNYIIDYHRSPKSQLLSDTDLNHSDTSQAYTNHISPEIDSISKEELGIVETVINGLSDRDREFVLLNRVDGLTYTEIAKRAGMSRSGVQKIIMQALSKCMDALDTE